MSLQDVKEKYNKYNEMLAKEKQMPNGDWDEQKLQEQAATIAALWDGIQDLYDALEITEEAYLKLKKIYDKCHVDEKEED